MIYTDHCNKDSEDKIKKELGMLVLKQMPKETWNINDALTVLTTPKIKLAVFNVIDDVTIMEIGLLSFLAKPILVTHNSIKEYPVLERTVTHIDVESNLRFDRNNFIKWYNLYGE